MKKLVLFIAVALFATSSLFAQDRPKRERATPEERAKRQTEMLAKALELTEDQKAKVLEINLKYAQPTKEGEKKENADREKLREEFKKQYEERTAAIKAVLTADQIKKFDEHQKDAQKRGRDGQGRRGERK